MRCRIFLLQKISINIIILEKIFSALKEKSFSNLFSTIQHETGLIPHVRLISLCENYNTNKNIHIESSRSKILDLREVYLNP